MNSEEKRLLEDILFQTHVICMILYANMQNGNVNNSEFIKNGVENEMMWMKEFVEARKAEEAKPRDPFREYWEAHQEDRQNSKLNEEINYKQGGERCES